MNDFPIEFFQVFEKLASILQNCFYKGVEITLPGNFMESILQSDKKRTKMKITDKQQPSI